MKREEEPERRESEKRSKGRELGNQESEKGEKDIQKGQKQAAGGYHYYVERMDRFPCHNWPLACFGGTASSHSPNQNSFSYNDNNMNQSYWSKKAKSNHIHTL